MEYEEKTNQDAREHGGFEDTLAAKNATSTEHRLTILEGFKQYPKAVAWSMLISATIIMEGYDTAFVGSLYAEASFQKAYGTAYSGGYQIPAKWQTGISVASNIGSIIGIFINAPISERFGHKKVLIGSLIVLCCLIFINFFSPSLPVYLVGFLLCGLPYGVFSTTAPIYASEICPVVLRGYTTTYVCLCWV